jgi:hypothetical protein
MKEAPFYWATCINHKPVEDSAFTMRLVRKRMQLVIHCWRDVTVYHSCGVDFNS